MVRTALKFCLIFFGICSSALAAEKTYCDRMGSIDHLPHLDDVQFKNYQKDGGSVDRILVSKYRRELYLLHDDVVLRTYRVAFGMDPWGGPKHFEGDQKTPEGVYEIDYKNPQSAYFLSLHVSYPNAADVAYAKARNRSPGGDIMVHGFPVNPVKHKIFEGLHPNDWTQGCMAVTDKEIKEIYDLVKEKTKIEICSYQQR